MRVQRTAQRARPPVVQVNRVRSQASSSLAVIILSMSVPRLARKAEFACDCVDPELACNYRFPTLGLELWREMAYHPKLLDNPEFQAHMRVLPENLEYEQTHGWTFQAVWVRSSASMAALPLEPCRAPYDGGPYHPTPEPRPVTPERLAAVAKKYGLEPPGRPGGGENA